MHLKTARQDLTGGALVRGTGQRRPADGHQCGERTGRLQEDRTVTPTAGPDCELMAWGRPAAVCCVCLYVCGAARVMAIVLWGT